MNEAVEEMLELFPNLDPEDIEAVLEALASDDETSYGDFTGQLDKLNDDRYNYDTYSK